MALAKRKPWSWKKKALTAAGAVGALGLGALGARRLFAKKLAKKAVSKTVKTSAPIATPAGGFVLKTTKPQNPIQDRVVQKLKEMGLHGAADQYKVGKLNPNTRIKIPIRPWLKPGHRLPSGPLLSRVQRGHLREASRLRKVALNFAQIQSKASRKAGRYQPQLPSPDMVNRFKRVDPGGVIIQRDAVQSPRFANTSTRERLKMLSIISRKLIQITREQRKNAGITLSRQIPKRPSRGEKVLNLNEYRRR